MTPILFDKLETRFASWGLGYITDLISCTVTEERNGDFLLEAVLSIESPIYDKIKCDRIIYAQCYDEEKIYRQSGPGATYETYTVTKNQPFRIYSISKPLGGKVTIKAEHLAREKMRNIVLAPLAEPVTVQSYYGNRGEWEALGKYGSTGSNLVFTAMQTSKTLPAHKTPMPAKDYMQGTEESILDVNKGIEYAYHNNIVIAACQGRGAASPAVVRYGRDMTEFKQDEEILGVYTGVVAYYYKTEEVEGETEGTKETVETYVDSGAVWGAHRMDYAEGRLMILDRSSDYDETPTQAQLRADANAYITDNELGTPKINYTIDLAPVWASTDGDGLTALRLCDTVGVYMEPLGITAQAKVIKTEYNVLKQRIDKITLGNAKASLPKTLVKLLKNTGVQLQ